jgi:hypothetical protein
VLVPQQPRPFGQQQSRIAAHPDADGLEPVRLGRPDVLEQPRDGAILGVQVELGHPCDHQIGHIATYEEPGAQADPHEQQPFDQLQDGDEAERPLA